MLAQLKTFILSILATSAISITLGSICGFLITSFYTETSFKMLTIGLSSLFFVLQFVVSYFIGAIRDMRVDNLTEVITADIKMDAEEMQHSLVALSCAYCNETNHVPVSMSKNNAFQCIKCNQLNKVFIQFQTTRVTKPIASTPVDLKDIAMDDEEEQNVQSTVNQNVEIS